MKVISELQKYGDHVKQYDNILVEPSIFIPLAVILVAVILYVVQEISLVQDTHRR
jgi:hypothetical protein